MKRSIRRATLALVAAAVLVPLAVGNLRLHRPGGLATGEAQLRFLDRSLASGGAEDMQRLFPEGFVFTWALYGLASAQVAEAHDPGSEERRRSLAEARRAVTAVRSGEARATFRDGMEPEHGAFYASWSLYLLAHYVRAAGVQSVDRPVLAAFREEAARFAAALEASETPFLPSYPYLAWPADTAVGVAALSIYNSVVAPDFAETVTRWVEDASARTDPEWGVLSHEAESETGAPAGGVRGSSLALLSRVLVDVDRAFARRHYVALREHFVDQRFLAPGVREYPHGVDGPGDVDTGPILLGYSGPALVVGAGAALAHGDVELARTLLGVVEAVGAPLELAERRRYAGGFLPVGDAFIAWARTTPVPDGTTPDAWPRLTSRWWWLPAHLLSSLLAALLIWRAWTLWPRSHE